MQFDTLKYDMLLCCMLGYSQRVMHTMMVRYTRTVSCTVCYSQGVMHVHNVYNGMV